MTPPYMTLFETGVTPEGCWFHCHRILPVEKDVKKVTEKFLPNDRGFMDFFYEVAKICNVFNFNVMTNLMNCKFSDYYGYNFL